ncbi:enoyl-CoA hydratase/carnithine racemase [Halopolyspora algeriensis]|uniref:Enoyl-CoA hydratase/carnithine racemase n=1 Tax=Halopolyspora algeriensis TaxID=1500506 RepID=A0A368VKD1_9ACTN|nr:crotonase/enoyl-CoA hydratase family protein [Halopolyspora algeriensis]RCW41009.1 enoyl-CoA hydratase/carnithine racemase [Halopolyspora algeriensis]TQM53907.1 enoyl-CoA hydratase/carnithine racemase [Halopolyspora algeriensis]
MTDLVEESTNDVDHRVACTVEDGVAEVRLARADKLNALDPAMFSALVTTGLRIRDDPRVRAVVLHGAGRGFCAGLDVDSFRDMVTGDHEPDRQQAAPAEPIGPARAPGQQAAHVWAHLPIPVIAAVHGVALGGGLQVALGADIRLVAPDAHLSVMEVRWGLIPDMTGTQLLPELVGRDVAKELTFTGRVVTGQEAVALGLATRVEADPLAAARTLAAEIAAKSPDAIRHAKHLLDSAGHVSLETGFAAEQDSIRALIGSSNQTEAVEANFARRAPSFTDPSPYRPAQERR